jgi:ribose transport system substrate-binding protein
MVATTRRILGITTAAALLVVALGGAVQGQDGVNEEAKSFALPDGSTFSLAQRIIDKAAAGETLNIVVNNQGVAIPVFGAEQQIGTDRGCEANGDRGLSIACRLTGPPTTDQTAQLAELETLLASDQVDCLGIQSITPDAYVDVINKYIDAGIPVFTQNTDVPNSKRIAFFALNEFDAGVANGRTTAALVEELGLPIGGIAMGSGGPEAPWAQDRMGGFRQGFLEVFPDADFRQTDVNDAGQVLDGIPTGPGYTTQEVIDSVGPFLQANQDVNLFFHTDQGVEGVGEVIERAGMAGQQWASGFNVSLRILDLIDAGIVLTTINQGFDNQAEAAVRACVDLLADGVRPADPLAYLDPIIITKDAAGGATESSTEAREKLLTVLGES